MAASPQVESPTNSWLMNSSEAFGQLFKDPSEVPLIRSISEGSRLNLSEFSPISEDQPDEPPNEQDRQWADQRVIDQLREMPMDRAIASIMGGGAQKYAEQLASQRARIRQTVARLVQDPFNPSGATPPISCSTNLPKRTQSN